MTEMTLDISEYLSAYFYYLLTPTNNFYFFPPCFRDESPVKTDFVQQLIEDKTEGAFSYYEFLLHIQQQVCK